MKERTFRVSQLETDEQKLSLSGEIGFNVLDWEVNGVKLIDGDVDKYAAGKTTGDPLIAGFPNRTRGGKFDWLGRTYNLLGMGFDEYLKERNGNGHHAFIFLPYNVGVAQLTERGMEIEAIARINQDMGLFPIYPFPCTITVRLVLDGSVLRKEFEVHNLGMIDQPFMVTDHPYFKVELGAEVCFPANRWFKQDETGVPTAFGPVPSVFDLSEPTPVDRFEKLDETFSDFPPGHYFATLTYPESGFVLEIEGSPVFKHGVVYRSPDGDVCLEPATSMTDAVHWYFRESDVANLVVIKPGRGGRGGLNIG
jgi:galactose mutarotase-like enzyme